MEVITMEKIILIKYGELTTKKANRSLFINRIYENMKLSLAGYNVKISKNRVRMFIETEDNLSQEGTCWIFKKRQGLRWW